MADSPQLPEHTQPAPRTDSPEDAALIGIAEAEELFGLADSTIRRKLRQHKVVGARRVPGKSGEEWRFPPESLELLGYQRKDKDPLEQAASSTLEQVVEDSLAELREQLRTMRELREREQLQLNAAQQDRANSEVEVARLEEQNRALEERYRESLELGWLARRKRRKALANLDSPEQ